MSFAGKIKPRWIPNLRSSDVLGAVGDLFQKKDHGAEYIEALKRYFHKEYVVLFPMARLALFAIMTSCLPPRSEVLLAAGTVPVVVKYLQAADMTLRFIDAERGGYLVDVEKLCAGITEKTRCVIVTHLYGKSVDIARVREVCLARGVLLIEDAAQAFGSVISSVDPGIDGALCGTVGDIGLYSTGILKTCSTLLGGVVVTDRKDLFEKIMICKQKGCYDRASLTLIAKMLTNVMFIWLVNSPVFSLVFRVFRNIIRKLTTEFSAVTCCGSFSFRCCDRFRAALGLRVLPQMAQVLDLNAQKTIFLLEQLGQFSSGLRDRYYRYLNVPCPVREREKVIHQLNDAGYDVGPGSVLNFGGPACPEAAHFSAHDLDLPVHAGIQHEDLSAIARIVIPHYIHER